MGKYQRIFQQEKGSGVDVTVETLIKNIKTKETMTTEENKRMLALSCIVADLKTENNDTRRRESAHKETDRRRV